jgi:protocatechuate 3,4-dioxygenase beta subunit
MFLLGVPLLFANFALAQAGGSVSGTAVVTAPVQRNSTTPSPEAPKYKPDELCSIEGIVRNSATGEPLKKANLYANRINPPGTGLSASTSTDAEGKFSMKSIEPGQYRLTVSRPGFVQTSYGARPGLPQSGTTLTLDKGQTLKNIEFRIPPHSVITGRVFDDDGDPVQGAQIQLLRYQYVQGRRQLMPNGFAATNDLGEYRMFGIAPGKYYVSAIARDIWNSTIDHSSNQQADEGFAPTYYPGTSEIASATQLNVPLSRVIQGIDMMLRKTRTYRIRGNVLGGARGVNRGGMLFVQPKEGDIGMMGLGRSPAQWRGANGEFEVRGVRPGSYFIQANSYDADMQLTARVFVEVTDRDLEGVVLNLGPGFEVSGSVRVLGGAPLTFEDLTIGLQPKTMNPMGGYAGTRVKEGGVFVIPRVSQDVYYVSLRGGPPELYLKSARLGDVDVLEHGLDLSQASSVSGLELVMSPGAATVEGSVADEDGKPVRGAGVLLRPKSVKPETLSLLQKQVTTDQNGQFKIVNVTPGDYYLIAFDGRDGMEIQDPELFKEYESAAVKLALRDDAKESRALKVVVIKDN